MPEQAFKVFTDTRIDEITAGDSLDDLVAKYVMGWGIGGNDISPSLAPWAPSKYAADASHVVGMIKKLGATRTLLDETSNSDGRSQASFVRFSTATPWRCVHSATGATLSEAVCKAALRFVMGTMRQEAEAAPAAAPVAPDKEERPARKSLSQVTEIALVQAFRTAQLFVNVRCAKNTHGDGPGSVDEWKAFFDLERAVEMAEERLEIDCAEGYKLPITRTT